MKKILFAILFCTSALLASAQEAKEGKAKDSDIPVAVKATFAKLYPGMKADKWEKEKGNYEVAFKKENTKMSLLIDPAGNLQETETAINISELPKSVTDYIAKNKAGKKIKDAAKIVDTKGVMTYEAEVDKMDLLFDKDGKFIKESKD
ncbi:MAG: PepSY-like domain-containing protein [Bacteroidia bacterium]